MTPEERQKLIDTRSSELEGKHWRVIKRVATSVGIEDKGDSDWKDLCPQIAELALVEEGVIEPGDPIEVEPEETVVIPPEEEEPTALQETPKMSAGEMVGGDTPDDPETLVRQSGPPEPKTMTLVTPGSNPTTQNLTLAEFARSNNQGFCAKCQQPHKFNIYRKPVCPLQLEDCERNGTSY